jgi:hypothetical protein
MVSRRMPTKSVGCRSGPAPCGVLADPSRLRGATFCWPRRAPDGECLPHARSAMQLLSQREHHRRSARAGRLRRRASRGRAARAGPTSTSLERAPFMLLAWTHLPPSSSAYSRAQFIVSTHDPKLLRWREQRIRPLCGAAVGHCALTSRTSLLAVPQVAKLAHR